MNTYEDIDSMFDEDGIYDYKLPDTTTCDCELSSIGELPNT